MVVDIKLIWATVLIVATSSAAKLGTDREARFFRYSYTKTEIVPKMITSLIPSSCVQVEASLPPCRTVRNLDEFPRFMGGRTFNGDEMPNESLAVIPQVLTTPLGWGEYLGIYAPTVTVKAIHLHTTTVSDPRTVVTFSVKGCKPSRLPMDLELCSPTKPVVEIQPTPSTVQVITSTVTPGIISTPGTTTQAILEPTEATIPVTNDNINKQTEELKTV